MPYDTITLSTAGSTVPGASAAVNLNWRGGGPATVSLTWASSSTLGTTQLQYTLDDLQLVTSTAVVWLPVGNSSVASSTPFVITQTNYFDTGFTQSFAYPIGAVRMFSTGITAGGSQVVSMRVMEGE